MLRDRIVCGINDDRIQRRLLAEHELTFKKAIEMASAFEMASKNLVDLGELTPTDNVNKVGEGSKSANPEWKRDCFRCGGHHNQQTCKFKHEVCYKCQKKGHMAKVCRGKKKKLEKPPKRQGGRRPEEKQKANFLAQDENEVYTMDHMSGKNKKSYTVWKNNNHGNQYWCIKDGIKRSNL